MVLGIFAHGWSLSLARNERRHSEGSTTPRRRKTRTPLVRPASLAWGMFGFGVSCYLACRFVSQPGEYRGRVEMVYSPLGALQEDDASVRHCKNYPKTVFV